MQADITKKSKKVTQKNAHKELVAQKRKSYSKVKKTIIDWSIVYSDVRIFIYSPIV